MAKFQKGQPRPIGAGRKKGSENKFNSEVREMVTALVSKNAAQLQTWLDKVAEDNPAKAFDLLVKMAEYVIPKKARIEHRETADTQQKKIIIQFVEPSRFLSNIDTH